VHPALVDRLHLTINLGGADAHAAAFNTVIRTAVDDDSAMFSELAVVAVVPHRETAQ
jgi:hypothetical protein